MQLKQLITVTNETEGILQSYANIYEIKEFASLEELETYRKELEYYILLQKELRDMEKMLENCQIPLSKEKKDKMKEWLYKYQTIKNTEYIKLEECLLVTATDETIAWANEKHIPVLAYQNPNICGQSLSQVEMIVEGFEEVDGEFLKRVWQRYHHLPWTIAETERCIIRELTLQDMDALFTLYADKDISKFTENLFDKEEETEYQRAYINNMYRYFGYGIWLVFHKETGDLIGRAGLEHREYGEELELELGYLIEKKYQRQGYATEVCKAIIDYAKDEICAFGVNCLIEEENTASIALAKKLGFQFLEYFETKGKKMLRFRIAFDA